MKKYLISLVLALAVMFGIFYSRGFILDLLPIDQSGWVQREGVWYLLNEKGDPRTGWAKTREGTFYFDLDGAMYTGWLEENGDTFYFDPNGNLHTGWLEMMGERYYFHEDGALATGLLEMDGKRYQLDENGSPRTGFFQVGDALCYIFEDGRIPSGWLDIESDRYYLSENGAVQTGWVEDGENRFYLDADGRMVSGWTDTVEGRFYLNEDGALATGWTEIEGERYFFDENGLPCSGWTELDGNRYYLAEGGTVYSGWLEEDGKRYYIREDGTPAVGKLEIDGENYFFSSTGMNFIMVNPWNELPEDFELPELVQTQGAWLDPVCQEALEKMLADCKAAGYSPMVKSSYRSLADQKANLQRMVQSYQQKGYSYNQAYAAATQIVAVPGTSEHHLGLAFDIVDSAYTNLNHQQAERPTQKWLMEHCWEYGFILRYPEDSTDITGIIWEPWHYRYVGTELAKEIHEMGDVILEVYIDNLTNDGTTCGGKLVKLD